MPGQVYDSATVTKYYGVCAIANDPRANANERATAQRLKERMEAKYPGIAEQGKAGGAAPGGAAPGGQGRGGGGATGFGFGSNGAVPPPPFGFADWLSFAGAAAGGFVDFLNKVVADLDEQNSATDIKQIVEQLEFKRRIDVKNGIVSLRFDFDQEDLEEIVKSDTSFNVGAEHFGKIAEAAFRRTFGAE
jgi:hypothetical protein